MPYTRNEITTSSQQKKFAVKPLNNIKDNDI